MLASQVFRKLLVLPTPRLAQMLKDAPFSEILHDLGFEKIAVFKKFSKKHQIHSKSVFLFNKIIIDQKPLYYEN